MPNWTIVKDPATEAITPFATQENGDIVGLPINDRIGTLMHLWGETGQGKSYVLANLILSDIYQSRGGLFIDPYADVADLVLEHVPEDRRSKIAVFDLNEASVDKNMERFGEEIHITEMVKDPKKFLFIRMHGSKVDKAIAAEFGKQLISSFLGALEQEDQLSSRSLILDDASRLIDSAVLEQILGVKEKGMVCVLTDQQTDQYPSEILETLTSQTEHVMCYKTDENTVQTLVDTYKFTCNSSDILSQERYHPVVQFKIGGEKVEDKGLRGVYPIVYPSK
jgi:hypothetical protein